jgi:DNA-binding CsgD family transcriptional regulator
MSETITPASDVDLLALVGPTIRESLDGIDLPSYVIDAAGTLRWANSAASRLVGQRVGQPYLNCIPRDLHVRVKAHFARKVVGGTATDYDVAVLDSAGRRIELRIRSAPLRRHDEIVGVFGVAIPLTGTPSRPNVPGRATDGRELTPRQAEVLRLLAEGLNTEAVAERLGVAVETARNHIRALLRRLGVHSRLEAVVEARRRGLVGRDGS